MNSPSIDVIISGSPNIMSFILKSMVEEHSRHAPLPEKLHMGLDIEGQKVTLKNEGEKVRIAPRTVSDAKVVFSGGMEHFLQTIIEGRIISAYLAGKLQFRGSPIQALKAYLWLRRICASLK